MFNAYLSRISSFLLNSLFNHLQLEIGLKGIKKIIDDIKNNKKIINNILEYYLYSVFL